MGVTWGDDPEVIRRFLEREPTPRPKIPPAYVLGLDLGQTHDYSALVIDEITDRGTSYSTHTIRYLKRWPLQTPYPAIVHEVERLTNRKPVTDRDTLVIDQTGVGRPVVDMFREAALGTQLTPITITGGNEVTHKANDWHVPKKVLISAVTVLLQSGRLRIVPSLKEAKTLRDELLNFKMKITLAANDTYGAWREGDNDDTVLATALACWYGEYNGPAGVWLA